MDQTLTAIRPLTCWHRAGAVSCAPMLDNIRVVLVGTSHPGNIGGVARAMKNMGLSALYLVQPEDYPSAEATSRASGADDVLARAKICRNLDEALEGCGFVLGTSARLRRLAWPQLEPREAAVSAIREAATTSVAMVFGRERTGLSNEELERCHYLIHIPTNPDYSSLNLAAAVQVITYELRLAALTWTSSQAPAPEEVAAPAEEMERFYAHLERVLVAVDFLDPDNPRLLMRRLRRLFNRVRPDRQELNILRGILTAVENDRPRRSASEPPADVHGK